MTDKQDKIGIIGGSGLYHLPGLDVQEERCLETPWGVPSSPYILATLAGREVVFLARHGKGHRILPHEINARANMAGFKHLGVGTVLAFSAVGSLREELKPLDFAMPDQLIDRTRARPSTFFGEGVAGHVAFADPYCPQVKGAVADAAGELSIPMHAGETLVCIDGPTFSTRAESLLYRSWGVGLINMSALPEARLAREAELCYRLICMVTDYDCWRTATDDVSIGDILANLSKNADNARRLVEAIVSRLPESSDCACRHAAEHALITAPACRTPRQEERLRYIYGEKFSPSGGKSHE